MNDWWKAPVLQGEENDYGQYDYMIEEIPSHTARWGWWPKACDECGKEHKFNLTYTGYFRTMDGYDSLDNCECWVCYAKRKIKQPFKVIQKKIKFFIIAQKEIYRLKSMLKNKNHPITKELKATIREISKRYAAREV